MRKLPASTWPYLFWLACVVTFSLFYLLHEVIWSNW